MKHFSISEIVGHSWKLFKANWILLVGLSLLNWAISFINNHISKIGHATKVPEHLALYAFTALSLGILSTLIHIGLIQMGLDIVDGKKPKPEELLSHTSLFWKFIFVSIIIGGVIAVSIAIPAGLGFLLAYTLHKFSYLSLAFLALIPATYFSLIFFFAPVILVDTNSKFVETFKKSALMTKHNRISLLGFGLALIAINIFGAILLGFGLLITIPVTFLAYISLYRKFA